jgi:hypothetical protein
VGKVKTSEKQQTFRETTLLKNTQKNRYSLDFSKTPP